MIRRLLWAVRHESLPLRSSSGAGHTIRGAYRVYGEGSIHHSSDDPVDPCEHGLGARHPMVVRTDYPSFWAYVRSEIATYLWQLSFQSRDMAPFFNKAWPRDKPIPATWLDRLSAKIGKPSWQYPSVRAALRPEDSIYDRSDMLDED